MVHAKVIANPQTNGLANKAGMVVMQPGSDAPTGNNSGYTYRLIAFGKTNAFNLSTLPDGTAGVYGGNAYHGVYGDGSQYGVY